MAEAHSSDPIYEPYTRHLKVSSNTSGSGADLTLATLAKGVRRLIGVTVKYSAAASVAVTITLDSQLGATFDRQLNTITLTAETEGDYYPAHDVFMADGDTIKVFAPLLAAQTSSVAIYYVAL